MRFIDEETGRTSMLFPTVELQVDLQSHQARFFCDHPEIQLRRRTVGRGTIQITNQCLRCGIAVGNAVKKDQTHDNIPPFDVNMASVFEKGRMSEYLSIGRKHLKIQNDREGSHQKEYEAYLTTPQWAEKRLKVLNRAKGVCEGCCERFARQIHHLTYNHIFDEFLFELVALCDPCHQRLHPGLSCIAGEPNTYSQPPCCACRWQDEQDGVDWCAKFDVSATAAMAEEGPCGPRHTELEGLK